MIREESDFELLRSLWEGDEDATAYQHSAIVFRLCTLTAKYTEPTTQWVLGRLHKQWAEERECSKEELAIIEWGIKRWHDAGDPRISDRPMLVSGN